MKSNGNRKSYWMEVQRVDRVYFSAISVAFEGEVFTLL